MVVYLDASAAVKLVVPEAESEALLAALRFRSLVSSELVVMEMFRAAARVDPERAFDAFR